MFESFLENKNSWLNGKGPESNIIFSSRIRFARNLSNYHFPWKASIEEKEEILKEIFSFYKNIDLLKDAIFIDMKDLEDLDKQFLLERHIISQEFIGPSRGKGLILTLDEVISIMINEEDHLRMQIIKSGFDLKKAESLLNRIDDEFSKFFSFAFLSDLGYLTSCPTNVGTGLRVSCMLHLPALVLTRRINKVLDALSKISFTARGLFGEGTQNLGDFFQISNQNSLGLSEIEFIDNLSSVVKEIKEQELEARDLLLKKYRISLEDSVYRAYALLCNSRIMSSKEAFSHLSMLALGIDLNIIENIRRDVVNNLFIIIQPAHLQKLKKSILKEEERDYIRATILRERLTGFKRQ